MVPNCVKEDLQEEVINEASMKRLMQAKLRKAKLVSTQMITVSKEEAAAKKAIDDAAKLATDESDKAEAEKKKELKTLQEETLLNQHQHGGSLIEIEKVTEH